MKSPLVRLFLVAAVYLTVIKMGYGLIAGFVLTFVLILVFNIALKVTGFFLGRRTR